MNKDAKINLNGIDVYDDTRYKIESRFVFTKEEFEKIKQGYARRSSMDYRWYITCKDDCVYILRSWNPFIVYKTQFEKVGDSYISCTSQSQFSIEGKDYQQTVLRQNYHNFWIYGLISHLIFNIAPLTSLETLVWKTKIDFNGVHGFAHWQAVYRMGKRLYPEIDTSVLFYFAVFHDFFRTTDYTDKDHGKNALYAIPSIKIDLKMWNKEKDLYLSQIDKIAFAIENHECTPGELAALNNPLKNDKTVRICLDADRLDLGRVGVNPDSKYLLTDEARKYNDNRVI